MASGGPHNDPIVPVAAHTPSAAADMPSATEAPAALPAVPPGHAVVSPGGKAAEPSSPLQLQQLQPDGSAADPRAFQRALLADPAAVAQLEPHPDVLAVVRGDDMEALQQLLRQAMQASW